MNLTASATTTSTFNNAIPPLPHRALPIAYRVKSGDTLSRIVARHYQLSPGSSAFDHALQVAAYSNPHITNIDRIYPGQIIRLISLPNGGANAFCSLGDILKNFEASHAEVDAFIRQSNLHISNLDRLQHYWPSDQTEQEMFFMLAWLEENYGILSASVAAGFNTFDGVVNTAHQALIAEVKTSYRLYQQGTITQNQYDYRRQKALKAFAEKVGPFEKFLMKGKSTQEAIRINRSKSLPATGKIDRMLSRLKGLSQASKYGGILLTGAGLGVGCYQIAQEDNRMRKNEIFVETIASTSAGVISSLALGIFLFSTPVGWTVALAAGASAAFGSFAAGKGAVTLYNIAGQEKDLVGITGVDTVCR